MVRFFIEQFFCFAVCFVSDRVTTLKREDDLSACKYVCSISLQLQEKATKRKNSDPLVLAWRQKAKDILEIPDDDFFPSEYNEK